MSALERPATTVAMLGLGGAPLGNLFSAIDDETAQVTVDAAWEAGMRFFDTAPHYGLGLSERRLGRALADRPRGEFQVCTKVGRLLIPNARPSGSDLEAGGFDVPDELVRRRDYSRDGVRRSLEESLERLGLDRVDVALIHDPEDHLEQALGEALPALCQLRDEGLVGVVGAGMNFVEPLQRFAAEGADVVMVAGRWTLLDRSAASLLDTCRDRDVAVLVAGPFNSGILARPEPPTSGTFDYAPASPDLLSRVRAMAEACLMYGTTLPAAALQYTLRHPAVARVIAGFRSSDEVTQAVRGLHEPIPDALWDQLDGVLR